MARKNDKLCEFSLDYDGIVRDLVNVLVPPSSGSVGHSFNDVLAPPQSGLVGRSLVGSMVMFWPHLRVD